MRLPDRNPNTTPLAFTTKLHTDTYEGETWYSNGHILLKGEAPDIEKNVKVINGTIPTYLEDFKAKIKLRGKQTLKATTEITYQPNIPNTKSKHFIKLNRRNLFINSIFFDNAELCFPGCQLYQEKQSKPISPIAIEHNNALVGMIMPIEPGKKLLKQVRENRK